jgi:xanthine dehydrogenase accessory factor
MLEQFLKNTIDLKKKNEPFAIAVVVRREAPSSGKVGDKALVNKHGEMIGWVGGGCVKGILVKERKSKVGKNWEIVNPVKPGGRYGI